MSYLYVMSYFIHIGEYPDLPPNDSDNTFLRKSNLDALFDLLDKYDLWAEYMVLTLQHEGFSLTEKEIKEIEAKCQKA